MTDFNPAELIMFGFEGTDPTDALTRVGNAGAYGVILFRRNCTSMEQVAALTGELEACWPNGRPAIAIDHEGSRVNRLRDFHEETLGAALLGRQDDLAETENFGKRIAETLRSLGVHINFAPVLDIEEIEDHPALKGRCFGTTARVVAAHGRAFIQAMQEAGVSGCGKHFPGHGSAHLDSHVALPESPRTLDQLIERDLKPYPELFRAGLDMVMTAHVVFPEISTLPSTCSRPMLTTLLRETMHFNGLVFSDDCDMEGFRRVGPIRETAVRAMEAGVDILLCCRDPELLDEVRAGLHDFYRSGSGARARIEEALGRAKRVKKGVFARFDSVITEP